MKSINTIGYDEYLNFSVPKTREAFIARQTNPEYTDGLPVRIDVINFIADMLYETGADPISVHKLFACGFCYHFAVILQHEFGGSIKWMKGCSHIVWTDENNLAYDIEGFRNDLQYVEVVPLEELDKAAEGTEYGGLESFRHRYPEYRLIQE